MTLLSVSPHTLQPVYNNNNNPICKAPECQKTSVALDLQLNIAADC